MQQTREFTFKQAIERHTKYSGTGYVELSTTPFLTMRLEESVTLDRFDLRSIMSDMVDMQPMAYLRKYCFVTPNVRMLLSVRYQKCTNKNKPKLTRNELAKETRKFLCAEVSVEELSSKFNCWSRNSFFLQSICCNFIYCVSFMKGI